MKNITIWIMRDADALQEDIKVFPNEVSARKAAVDLWNHLMPNERSNRTVSVEGWSVEIADEDARTAEQIWSDKLDDWDEDFWARGADEFFDIGAELAAQEAEANRRWQIKSSAEDEWVYGDDAKAEAFGDMDAWCMDAEQIERFAARAGLSLSDAYYLFEEV